VKRAQIFRLTDRRTRVREPRRRDNEPGGASPAAANDDTAPPTSASPSKNGPS
jgi:hypothetical protein